MLLASDIVQQAGGYKNVVVNMTFLFCNIQCNIEDSDPCLYPLLFIYFLCNRLYHTLRETTIMDFGCDEY